MIMSTKMKKVKYNDGVTVMGRDSEERLILTQSFMFSEENII